jgi:hypothetical protein
MWLSPFGEDDDTPLLQSFLDDAVGPIRPAPQVSPAPDHSVTTLARRNGRSLAGAVRYVPSTAHRSAHIPWLVPGDDTDIVVPLLGAALEHHRSAGGGTLEAFHDTTTGGPTGVAAAEQRAIMETFTGLGFAARLRGYVLRGTAPPPTVGISHTPLEITSVTPHVDRLSLTSAGRTLAEIFTGRVHDGAAAVWGLAHRPDRPDAGADLLDITLARLARHGAETVTAYTTAVAESAHATNSLAAYREARFTQVDWLFSYVSAGPGPEQPPTPPSSTRP